MKLRPTTQGRRVTAGAPAPRRARRRVVNLSASAASVAAVVGVAALIWGPTDRGDDPDPAPLDRAAVEQAVTDYFVPLLSVPVSKVTCTGGMTQTDGETQTCRVDTVVAPVDVAVTYAGKAQAVGVAAAENFTFAWTYDTDADPVKATLVTGFVEEQLSLPYPGSKNPTVSAECAEVLPSVVGAVTQCQVTRDEEPLLALVQVSELADGEPRLSLVSFTETDS